ncbi:MAG: putative molybdopterin oxidoreductase, rane subunit [Dehalococcoidia bacterium]|nr:putative molybdopterin oxidoreductase, rane subunit [Dehalococcoidia bacterium]
MLERPVLGRNNIEIDRKINRELLGSLFGMPSRFWMTVLFLGLVFATGMGAAGYMVNRGIGVSGLNRPGMWGFMLVNFVFWVGISHAGIMLSAILRLAQAEWRRPATRAAEVLTIFSLMNALMFPIFHTGRPWRTLYWEFPFDFARGIWPQVRSPLVWDPAAIVTYLTSTILFVFVALLPDFAAARDRTTGLRRMIYGVLSLGWRGYPKQWKLQIVAGFLLSALILPVFVSVHSIVSWDFAVAASVEGWHSTVFAPYFVIGAVWSGVGAVVTAMIFLRYVFHWENYIRRDHIDSLGRLLMVVGLGWGFFTALELLFSLYGLHTGEIALRKMQWFDPPFSWLFLLFAVSGFFFPVPMLMFRGIRRSFWWMTWVTISINIGMWLERFLIIIPGLARKQELPFSWATYHPSIIEILMVIGSFAFVGMMVLLFSRFVPLIPVYDIKEGERLRAEIKIGKRIIPAVLREE